MREVRREVTVIGPSAAGWLRVALGVAPDERDIDVQVDRIPAALRLPNSRFVGVFSVDGLVRVEAAGVAWLEAQGKVRAVLNRGWDPIGVAQMVDDEYDMYIAEIVSLLKANASEWAIVEHLRSIEAQSMGLTGSPTETLQRVVAALRDLALPPEVGRDGDAA